MLNRPSIVYDENESLRKRLKARYEVVCERHKANLEDAITIGRELEMLRRKCSHGDWLRDLEKTTIPQRTANRYMKVAEAAKLATGLISKCRTIAEAVQVWEENIGEQPAKDDGKEPKPVVYCIFCQHMLDHGGEATENCQTCLAERAQRKRRKGKRHRDDDEPAFSFSPGSLSIHAKMMLKQLDNLVADFGLQGDHPRIEQLRDQLRGWVGQTIGERDAFKRGEDPAQVARYAFKPQPPPHDGRI
jgi:hypothetical protein